MTSDSSHKQRAAPLSGFTLLEMMLVLLILSLIAGLFVAARISIVMDHKKDITLQRMDTLQKQLVWFRQINHRLPCPADPTLTIASTSYGTEQQSGNCDPTITGYPSVVTMGDGVPPTKTLGLADEFMYDGWGRRFRYAVVQAFTLPCAFAVYPVISAGYPGLTILDEAGNVLSTQKLYVLVSFGMDGHGGYLQSGVRFSANAQNANELANCNCDTNANSTGNVGPFVDAPFQYSDPGAETTFADILRYSSREQIPSQSDVAGISEGCTSGGTSGTGGGSSSSSGSSSGTSASGSSGGGSAASGSGGSSASASGSGSGSSGGSASSGGSGSGSSGGCTGGPCQIQGTACTSAGQCCRGLACISGVCVACSGPPYGDNCGCSSAADCQGGSCLPGCVTGYCSGGGCPCNGTSCDPAGCALHRAGHCVGMMCCAGSQCCSCQ